MSPLKTILLSHTCTFLTRVSRRWILLYVLLQGSDLLGQTLAPKEYQVKAVFIYNLTQFVEWPAEAFPTENSPMIIGVLGEDPFGNFLEETVRGEEMKGHPLVVEHYQNMEDIKPCHILFVNLSRPDQLKQVFNKLRSQPILTVSDVNYFTRLGGMVRLMNEDNRTKIRINLDATKRADLVMSSKLLKLAEIVSTQAN
jgi:hypothetical protein